MMMVVFFFKCGQSEIMRTLGTVQFGQGQAIYEQANH